MKGLLKKSVAEFIGTLVLVLVGTGVAAATGIWSSESRIILIALGFGLSLTVMAYAIGKISGCHVNPAVSLAMLINKRITFVEFIAYVVAQVLGAIAGSALLFGILNTCGIWSELANYGIGMNLGANGYYIASANPDYTSYMISMWGALLLEAVLSFIFVYAVLGITEKKENSSVAGLAVGGALALVHLFGVPFTGTSVNPARSFGPALMSSITNVNGDAIGQVWVFIVAPLVGAILAGLLFRFFNYEKTPVEKATIEAKKAEKEKAKVIELEKKEIAETKTVVKPEVKPANKPVEKTATKPVATNTVKKGAGRPKGSTNKKNTTKKPNKK